MQAIWFKDEICEELKGAENYLKCAIDTAKNYPDWSKTFYEMAEQEQEHATNIYEMFIDMYTNSEEPSSYMKSLRDSIMQCFSESMRKIEDHKTMYDTMFKHEETHNTKNINYTTEKPKTIL